ncbi:hypothetical protein [Devosia sp. A449]
MPFTPDQSNLHPLAPLPRQPAFEKLTTLKGAAAHFGLPYYKVQRAARAGIIPTYFVYNSRRLVKLSDVAAIINSSRQGGGNV